MGQVSHFSPPSSTSIKVKHKKVSPLAKVTSLLRKLNLNRSWLVDIIRGLRGKEKDGIVDNYIDIEDLINVDEKMILMSRWESRKDSDIKRISKKLRYLESFSRFPKSVIRKLVRHGQIIAFEAGRVLFEAGDNPLGAYFILSGQVKVGPDNANDTVQKLLEATNKENHEALLTLKTRYYGKNSLIGMDELLFGEPRPNITIVKEDVLFIRFERENILEAMLPLINRWHEIFQYLTTFEIFLYFEFEATRELSTIGKAKIYGASSLIDATETAYFLIKGKIIVIRRLLVEKYWKNGKLNKRLYQNQEATKYGQHVEPIFMQVCVLNKGSYFGIGERISKHQLWTATPCWFLYFSRDRLLNCGSPGLWAALSSRLDAFYPSDREIFKHYQCRRDWMEYKKDITSKVQRRTGLNTIHDVPISLRCNGMKMKRSFMKKVQMTKMADYLPGGIDFLEDVLAHKFVLDEGGPLREFLFGRFKTNPHQETENSRKISAPKKYDSFPSFCFYDALK